MKLFGKIIEFSKRNYRQIATVHKVVKAIVFITMTFTSIVMYKLGVLWLSGVIALVAILFLILTKLDNQL